MLDRFPYRVLCMVLFNYVMYMRLAITTSFRFQYSLQHDIANLRNKLSDNMTMHCTSLISTPFIASFNLVIFLTVIMITRNCS